MKYDPEKHGDVAGFSSYGAIFYMCTRKGYVFVCYFAKGKVDDWKLVPNVRV